MLEKAKVKHSVCKALVCKWHTGFPDGRTSIEDETGCGMTLIINGDLIRSVGDGIEKDRCQTVKEVQEQVGV